MLASRWLAADAMFTVNWLASGLPSPSITRPSTESPAVGSVHAAKKPVPDALLPSATWVWSPPMSASFIRASATGPARHW